MTMESREDLGNKDVLGQEVLESVGEPKEAMSEISESHESTGHETGDPLYVQKRLKQQKRAHEREIRELHSKLAEMQSQLRSTTPNAELTESYLGGGDTDINGAIHKAVSYALQQKEMEERKAKQLQSQQHVAKQYQDLQKHLDSVSDKYDDFDDVVRNDSVPFTEHMRDAALFLPKSGPGSAGEVLYKLGKNPGELERISKLHPLDQASELVALSHALIKGGEQQPSSPRPLGQVKANPAINSGGYTDKTPVSAIRHAMKQGKFR